MPDHKSVYVVFKTHFDIGFTHLAGEVVARYGAGMLADVVRTCEGTRHLPAGHRFVWTMPTWPLTKSLDPAVAPEDTLDRARALLKDGQITWHALPFTTHTEFCGLEEYVRGLYRAAELDREYGRRTVAAKMTDVPGHTWMLPAILAHAGVKFLHLGCNPGCMPPDVPRLFWWEAPDGSRVLTFYSKGGYGTSLLPPDDWRYPVWLAMMQTNDNVGPQDAQVVEDMVRTVEARRPGDVLVLGTMDDFYRALLPYLGGEVPVVRRDLADSWIHGVATYPAEVARLRALRGRLADVESWGAGLAARGLLAAPAAAEIEARIAEGYQTALLFGEHTWGLDVKTTLGWRRAYEKAAFRESLNWPETRRIEASWDEQRDRVRAVEAQIDGACRLLPVGDGDIAVYNGLGCPRDAWADLTAWRDRAARGVADGRDGSSLPLAETPEGLFARVRALPPLGGVALRLTPGAGANGGGVLCDSATGILENRWVRVRVDRAMGGIASLVDKASGREWVRPGEALGQYRYDVYGNAEITEFIRDYSYRFFDWLVNDLGRMGYPEIGHRMFVARDFEMRASAGAHCASVELH
ncbi:MAG: hypothetical protein GX558_10000, partial [Clostridiales bacterium]|nr:hypothetical protein [Clostridiales bacterium]